MMDHNFAHGEINDVVAQPNPYEKAIVDRKPWVQRTKPAIAIIGLPLSHGKLEHVHEVSNAKKCKIAYKMFASVMHL